MMRRRTGFALGAAQILFTLDCLESELEHRAVVVTFLPRNPSGGRCRCRTRFPCGSFRIRVLALADGVSLSRPAQSR
jgi:hypothetical protein